MWLRVDCRAHFIIACLKGLSSRTYYTITILQGERTLLIRGVHGLNTDHRKLILAALDALDDQSLAWTYTTLNP